MVEHQTPISGSPRYPWVPWGGGVVFSNGPGQLRVGSVSVHTSDKKDYRTGANNGRSWIGAALEYRPQFLDQKIFFCIKASLNHKPQKILNSGT